jgi:hypothetical protein
MRPSGLISGLLLWPRGGGGELVLRVGGTSPDDFTHPGENAVECDEDRTQSALKLTWLFCLFGKDHCP